MKLVALMPGKISTTTMQSFKVSWGFCHEDMSWSPRGNALLGLQFVLVWVQRISMLGSLDHRLHTCTTLITDYS